MATVLLSTALQRYCGGTERLHGTGTTLLSVLRDAASSHEDLMAKLFGPGANISPSFFVHVDGALVTREELDKRSVEETEVIRLSLFVGGG